MTTEPHPRRIILVPIDLQGTSRASLETLVRIARQLDRPLLGLMLEDVRLQQVADLPFTTEIALSSGAERSLHRGQLSRRHSQVNTDTRRLLKKLANRDQVELVFENAAGNRLHTAFQHDDQLDIFFPARRRWQRIPAHRPAAGAAIGRLGIVLAGTAQDYKVVETTQLLQKAGLVGDIYVISANPLDRKQLDGLYRPGSRICVQANLSCDPATLSRLIRQSVYDLLLLPRDIIAGIAPEVMEAALDKAGGQVLMIT
jgi:hypothetical protein